MFDLTDLDLRYSNHGRKVARVNHEGWKREALPTAIGKPRGLANLVATMRRHGGVALVRMGERIQGPVADYPVNPKPAA